MRTFRPYSFYTVALLLATLILGGKLTLLIFSAKATGGYDRVAVFLFASLFVLTLFAFLYLLANSVTVSEGKVAKKTVFGVKEINFADLIDLSVVDMKSRFIIFLVSNDKFIMFSSLLSNFGELGNLLRRGVAQYNTQLTDALDKITDKKLAAKDRLLKVALVFAIALVTAIAVKR